MISVRQSEDGRTVVDFTVPGCIHAENVALVGDFNDWSREVNPMIRSSQGDWSASVELAPGRYRFRYVADDDRWLNDWSAHDYVANAFGGEDSVVLVPDPRAEARSMSISDDASCATVTG